MHPAFRDEATEPGFYPMMAYNERKVQCKKNKTIEGKFESILTRVV